MTIKLSRAAPRRLTRTPEILDGNSALKLSARPKTARKAGLPNIGVLQAQPRRAPHRSVSMRDQMQRKVPRAGRARPGLQARSDLLSISRKDWVNTAPAVDRSEAATASSAACRGEPRLKTSLTYATRPRQQSSSPQFPCPSAANRRRRGEAQASRPVRPTRDGARSRGSSPGRPGRRRSCAAALQSANA